MRKFFMSEYTQTCVLCICIQCFSTHKLFTLKQRRLSNIIKKFSGILTRLFISSLVADIDWDNFLISLLFVAGNRPADRVGDNYCISNDIFVSSRNLRFEKMRRINTTTLLNRIYAKGVIDCIIINQFIFSVWAMASNNIWILIIFIWFRETREIV